MAAINQIKLNSTSTTYDVNDKRITTTAVTTATHFLTTDSSVSSIAPITAANAASVLGAAKTISYITGGSASHRKLVITNATNNKSFLKIFYNQYNGATLEEYTVYRTNNSTWVLSPTNASAASFTSIDDMTISTYSGLTVFAFNCDAQLQSA